MTLTHQTWWPLRFGGDWHPQLGLSFDQFPEFARLLGLMLERWALIEGEIATSLSHLLDGNEEAATAIIYGLPTTRSRLEITRAVARAVMPDGPEKSGFLFLIDKIKDLSERRNQYVHGEFHGTGEGGKLEMLTIRPLSTNSRERRKVSTKPHF